MTILLKGLSKPGVAVPVDLVKERLQDEGCAPPIQNVHLSLSRTRLLVRWYTRSLKDYVEEGNFIHDKLELWN